VRKEPDEPNEPNVVYLWLFWLLWLINHLYKGGVFMEEIIIKILVALGVVKPAVVPVKSR